MSYSCSRYANRSYRFHPYPGPPTSKQAPAILPYHKAGPPNAVVLPAVEMNGRLTVRRLWCWVLRGGNSKEGRGGKGRRGEGIGLYHHASCFSTPPWSYYREVFISISVLFITNAETVIFCLSLSPSLCLCVCVCVCVCVCTCVCVCVCVCTCVCARTHVYMCMRELGDHHSPYHLHVVYPLSVYQPSNLRTFKSPSASGGDPSYFEF